MNASAHITSRTDKSFTLQIEVPLHSNILQAEEAIQEALNVGGVEATREAMKQHDTDGSPIMVCGQKLTSKGLKNKEVQTPYGPLDIERHVYQSTKGGKIFAPMDHASKLVNNASPKFAKMVTSKYSCDSAPGVQRDLKDNHGRSIALSYIKNLTDYVGAIAEAKEESWSYDIPKLPRTVKSISIGLDGTCLNMMDSGWREAMCGTIALFDNMGERMHTIYTAASPEHGKQKFLDKLGREVTRISKDYSGVTMLGLADGASSNWKFLENKVDILTIDFWHVTEYLSKAACAMYPKDSDRKIREEWLDNACHNLKHNKGAATRLLNFMVKYYETSNMSDSNAKILDTTITYFRNHKAKMKYYSNVANNMPIGSGVTEAACKSLVKQRMCKGSARWRDTGATVVLTLRSLHSTPDRWRQFWDKYSRFGAKVA